MDKGLVPLVERAHRRLPSGRGQSPQTGHHGSQTITQCPRFFWRGSCQQLKSRFQVTVNPGPTLKHRPFPDLLGPPCLAPKADAPPRSRPCSFILERKHPVPPGWSVVKGGQQMLTVVPTALGALRLQKRNHSRCHHHSGHFHGIPFSD